MQLSCQRRAIFYYSVENRFTKGIRQKAAEGYAAGILKITMHGL